jgi:hypothetical protein
MMRPLMQLSVLLLAVCSDGLSRGVNRVTTTKTIPQVQQASLQSTGSSRRKFLAAPVVLPLLGLSVFASQPAIAADSSKVSLQEAKDFVRGARKELDPLPALLSSESWDAVRTVLKIKLGKLWALGEAQNPIVQFAKSTEEPELFELAEELSTALQLADQFTCTVLLVVHSFPYSLFSLSLSLSLSFTCPTSHSTFTLW